MTQSKTSSLIETVVSIIVGYALNFTGLSLFMLYNGQPFQPFENMIFGLFMTAVAFLRIYGIRRLFNK